MTKRFYISLLFNLLLISVIAQIVFESTSAFIDDIETELALEMDNENEDDVEDDFLYFSDINFSTSTTAETPYFFDSYNTRVHVAFNEIRLPPPEQFV